MSLRGYDVWKLRSPDDCWHCVRCQSNPKRMFSDYCWECCDELDRIEAFWEAFDDYYQWEPAP